jgi:ClpP class serine protease
MAAHWAIMPDALATIVSIAERTNLPLEALEAQRGEKLKNAYAVTVRDGIATIPVAGPMFRYASFFTRISGATAYEDVARDFSAALDDPRIRGIVLSIDSPGGEVNGNAELSQMVYDARGKKPVVAYVSHLGASAAYWLASSADFVVISPTAILGSIGVAATVRKSNGKETTFDVVSTQSPKKRLDPATDDGLAAIQATLDALATVFVETVARNRGVTPEQVLADFGQGGVFVGQDAITAGLADAIGSYEGVIAQLRDGKAPSRTATRPGMTSAASAVTSIPETHMKDKTPGGTEGGAPSAEATAPAAPLATTAAPAAPAAGAATTGTDVVNLAAVRAEAQTAERTRIAAIRKLGKGVDAALVEQCIEDGSSADAAARVFLEAAQASTDARLTALKADESKAKHPSQASDAGEPADARAAAKAATSSYYALTAPTSTAR